MPSLLLLGWLSFLLFVVLWKSIRLAKNVRAAKASGLNYVIVPALETEIWGYLLTPLLRQIYHKHLLKGEGWPRWCRFTIKDFGWEDKRRAHEEYGDAFLVVSPEGIICYSANAELNHDAFCRRTEFLKPRDKYVLLEPLGANVATTEGKTYQFHVRITAPPFSDMSGVNSLVWNETLAQTRMITSSWAGSDSIDETEHQIDVNALTLAVISLAGCGIQTKWNSYAADQELQEVPPGYKISFLKAFHDSTNNLISILLAPKWLLGLLGKSDAALAHSQLEKYLRDMIHDENVKISKNINHESKNARGNLLTSLCRVSALEGRLASSQKALTSNERRGTMSEQEMTGNLWIYLLAGYEASSNGILYGLITLALYPEYQDRVVEEIDRVYAEAREEGRTELDYNRDFEKLEYTYGFMYETFRLFPGNAMITKMVHVPTKVSFAMTENSPVQDYLLPAGCRLYMNTAATHYNERYWKDPYKIDTERWSQAKSYSDSNKKIVASDKARQMRGTFLSFSDGARACLGRKFAQSEYIAHLVALLKDWRIELGAGMTRESVEKDLFLRCQGTITLRCLDTIKLKYVRRTPTA